MQQLMVVIINNVFFSFDDDDDYKFSMASFRTTEVLGSFELENIKHVDERPNNKNLHEKVRSGGSCVSTNLENQIQGVPKVMSGYVFGFSALFDLIISTFFK